MNLTKNFDELRVKHLTDFYKDLIAREFHIIEICSNSYYASKYEIALRQAGFLRPVGLFSMTLTKSIDVNSSVKYNRNWVRNLKKIAPGLLAFEKCEATSNDEINEFISIYNSMSDRKLIAHKISYPTIKSLLEHGDFELFVVKSEEKTLCGIITYKHGSNAIGFLAASSEEALKCHATFYMYDQLMHHLKTIGIMTYDISRLVPSTGSVNSVFLFKDGIEGEYKSFNGEWAYYKHKTLRPLMFFIKKYLMKKNDI